MKYERRIRELCEAGIEHPREITERDWYKLASAYMQEYPQDALEGLFVHSTDLNGSPSEAYKELQIIAENVPDSAREFIRAGMLFYGAVIDSIREDVAEKIAEYWDDYAETHYAHA